MIAILSGEMRLKASAAEARAGSQVAGRWGAPASVRITGCGMRWGELMYL